MPAIHEAEITISGHKLNFAESMTLRVAMNDFLLHLKHDGLGDDETGKKITENYIKQTNKILNYIHETAR